MGVDYAGLLSETVLELRILRERIFMKSNEISKGLTCHCKQAIVNHYLGCLSNVIMGVANFSLVIEHVNDSDSINYKFNFIKKTYRNTLNCVLYKDKTIEVKILALFQIVHQQIENLILDQICRRCITTLEGSDVFTDDIKFNLCEQNLDNIYDLAEHTIFSLSGLRINCHHLSNEIFQSPFIRQSLVNCKIDPEMIFKQAKEKDECCLSENSNSEVIRFFLTPECYQIAGWLDNVVDIYSTYHVNPGNIIIICDFKLMDPFKWLDFNEKIHFKMMNKFKNVLYANAPHVNFGKYIKNKEFTNSDDVIGCVASG